MYLKQTTQVGFRKPETLLPLTRLFQHTSYPIKPRTKKLRVQAKASEKMEAAHNSVHHATAFIAVKQRRRTSCTGTQVFNQLEDAQFAVGIIFTHNTRRHARKVMLQFAL